MCLSAVFLLMMLTRLHPMSYYQNHYEDMIKEHQGWELVGIYADEGVSGTSLQHRDEFTQMIEDCKAGKIDLIVTKSVSQICQKYCGLHCKGS